MYNFHACLIACGVVLRISRNVSPSSVYFGIKILAPMSYLKLWNCIFHQSVPLCPSRRRRRPIFVRPSVPSCPFRHRRPMFVQFPSVRPVVSIQTSLWSVLCSSVLPSRRPFRRCRPSSVRSSPTRVKRPTREKKRHVYIDLHVCE